MHEKGFAMLILQNACFIHVPKTGGRWVRQALLNAGVSFEDFQLHNTPHVNLQDCPVPCRFKFAFVRHPLTMYRSYWQFKMTYGWDDNNYFDRDCQSGQFHDFVHKVLTQHPGAYGRRLDEMVGKPDREIEYIGRFENLVEDLITALQRAGEDFDAERIRNTPPCNVSNKLRFPADYSAALESQIRETEHYALTRFHYA